MFLLNMIFNFWEKYHWSDWALAILQNVSKPSITWRWYPLDRMVNFSIYFWKKKNPWHDWTLAMLQHVSKALGFETLYINLNTTLFLKGRCFTKLGKFTWTKNICYAIFTRSAWYAYTQITVTLLLILFHKLVCTGISM